MKNSFNMGATVKRVISLALAFVLVLGHIPVGAHATDGDDYLIEEFNEGESATILPADNGDDTLPACVHGSHDADGNCYDCGVFVGHNFDASGNCSCGITCEHDSHDTDGNCSVCGTSVGHSYDSTGLCGCGAACSHDSHGTDGNCSVCGTSVGHSYDSTGLCGCGSECPHTSKTNGVCDTCGVADNHTHNFDTTGTCSCGTQAVAKATLGSETYYYVSAYDLKQALTSAMDDCTVQLLQDITYDYFYGDCGYYLDLNGHTFTLTDALALDSTSGGTIMDTSAEGSGKIVGTVYAAYSTALVSGTIEGTVCFPKKAGYTGYSFQVEGGTIDADMDFAVNDNYTTIKLTGGKFPGGISIACGDNVTTPMTLADCISGSYQYFLDGNLVTLTEGQTEITGGDVTVASHTGHTHFASLQYHPVQPTCTEDGTKGYYYCEGCGKKFEDQAATKEITDLTIPKLGHNFDENGFCTNEINSVICGAYEAPAGEGTEASPYLIDNAGKLYWFAAVVNGGYEDTAGNSAAWATVTDDITIPEGMAWTPISGYRGTFDGDSKTISGMHCTSDAYYVGMFSRTGKCTIKNVFLADSSFESTNVRGSVGTIAGYAGESDGNYTTISNCTTNNVTVTGYTAGGMVGTLYGFSEILNCRPDSTVIAEGEGGGVAGRCHSGSYIKGVSAQGTISGYYAGGIVGYVVNDAGPYATRSNDVVLSTFAGDVGDEDTLYAGGIIGFVTDGTKATINNCGVKGNIAAQESVNSRAAGLLGYGGGSSANVSVSNSFTVQTSLGTADINKASIATGGVKATNCYTDDQENPLVVGSSSANCEKKTTEQFESGEVTYLLDEPQSEHIWGQNVDNGNINYGFPVRNQPEVYQITIDCAGTLGYSNTNESKAVHDMTYTAGQPVTCTKDGTHENWYCSGCKKYFSDESGTTELTDLTIPALGHNYENGFCTNVNDGTVCDTYEPAVLVTAENAAELGVSGDYAGYYAISNAGQLYWFADKVDNENSAYKTANAVLTANITINSGTVDATSTGLRQWNPIGWYSSSSKKAVFSGTFDGNGKTVSGLYYNDTSGNYVGLIAWLEAGGTAKNVTLSDSYILANQEIGGIVGMNYGTITGCVNYATVSSDGAVGGITSQNYGIVELCGNAGPISNDNFYTGGITGYNDNGAHVRNCWNTGYVYGGKQYTGGIVGYNYSAMIDNCWNTGTMDSRYIPTGGIVGYTNEPLNNCYSTGSDPIGVAYSNITRDNCKNVENKTMEQFASGEVAYLLQTNLVMPEGQESAQIWGQNIDNGLPVQTVPVLFGARVYQITTDCLGTIAYSNTNESTSHAMTHTAGEPATCTKDGTHENWHCSVCKKYFSDEEGTTELTDLTIPALGHNYENGFCTNVNDGTVCDAYEPAVLVTAENAAELGVSADYAGYYAISNAGQLYWFAHKVDNENSAYKTANAVLTANITINSGTITADSTGLRQWNPIGWYSSSSKKAVFSGTFDGNGKTVSGLYYNDTSGNYVGLIAWLEAGGTAKNVTLSNSYILGNQDIGGIVGRNKGTVSDCFNYGAVSGTEYIGGIVGRHQGTVEFCGNAGQIIADTENAGGIAGGSSSGSKYVRNCWNTGYVQCAYSGAGGIVGDHYGGSVDNCWNTGTIKSTNNYAGEGGIVGWFNGGSSVYNVYSYPNRATGVHNYVSKDEYANIYKMTEADFASGKVAYLLQINQVTPEGQETVLFWGQNIDNGEPIQTVPVFYGAKVYEDLANCAGELGYSNTSTSNEFSHNFDDNGFCVNPRLNGDPCDAYEPAVLVTAENREALGLAESYIGYYAITNAGNLYWFADKVANENATYGTANAVLTDNITVNSGTITADSTGVREWKPIGGVPHTISFSGTLDGNGRTLSGLYFVGANSNQYYTAIVGKLGEGGAVKDLTLTNSYLYGYSNVGSMVGENYGTVRNCFNYATIRSSNSGAGGIVGRTLETGITEFCGNYGQVISDNGSAGGITTWNSGKVRNCYNTGSVTGGTKVGGIVSIQTGSYGSITNCYNTGSVTGSTYVSGIAGTAWYGSITNCYNTGVVTGSSGVGGVTVPDDQYNSATIKNCYYLTGTAAGGIGDSDVEGSAESKTAEQFASGEVAYLLQGSQKEQIWGQNIDNGQPVQTLPVFSDAKVYQYIKDCTGVYAYSNTKDHTADSHVMTYSPEIPATCAAEGTKENWYCSVCKKYFSDESGTTELTDLTIPKLDHSYVNGFCTIELADGVICDAYEPAVLVTAENAAELGLAESYIGYYAITNAGNLYWFADKVDNENDTYGSANVVLTKDITINSGTVDATSTGMRQWNPVGWYTVSDGDQALFSGTFDGNGKTVSGLYYNDPDGNDVGLIARLAAGGTAKNVTLSNSYILGNGHVGGIVGESRGTITGCVNYATVSGISSVGGIAGSNSYAGIIEFCGNAGQISGGDRCTGGITGDNNNYIRNCWNTGDVQSDGPYTGGIAGQNWDSIDNCWNTGTIDSWYGETGGIAGWHCGSVNNCCSSTTTGIGLCVENYTITNTYRKNLEEFASGEVAYLLQTNLVMPEGQESAQIWGQNLDNGEPVQTVPVLFGAKVYENLANCAGELSYSNTSTSNEYSHNFDDNGFCVNPRLNGDPCDAYEPAILVTAENREALGLAESFIGYYAITNAGNLYWFADKVDNENATYGSANVVLTKDITVNSGTITAESTGAREWNPIGVDTFGYSGIFEGNGKTISGLYFNKPEFIYFSPNSNIALVRRLEETGIVQNVTLTNSYLYGDDYVASMVAENYGTVRNCYNYATIRSSGTSSGGIVYRTLSTGITEFCGNAGQVISDNGAAGGIAQMNYGIIRNCWNTGSVTGNGYYNVGGIAGSANNGSITNCYNTGVVTGNYHVGGVAGYQTSSGKVKNCYYLTGTAAGGINGSDVEGSAEGKTEAQFASGEVAYLLQGDQTDHIWGQNIDNGQPVQTVPALYGAKVYYLVANCAGEKSYTNNETAGTHSHNFDDNGFCINVRLNDGVCDAYEPAVLVTAENCTELGLAESYIGYYAITNAGNLYWFADKVDNENATYGSANVVLTKDITINSGTVDATSTGMRQWNPIGWYTVSVGDQALFSGTFDGNGKTVSGLYYNDPDGNDVGLIARLAAGGTAKNVTLSNSYILGNGHVGGIVGESRGTITGCVNYATVSGISQIGGITGCNYGGTVEFCGNAGQISSSDLYTGGITGFNNLGGYVRNCWNIGSVQSDDNHTGGIVGWNYESIDNCWNTGSITGDKAAGGITGSGSGKVSNCYNTGSVTGGEDAGGIVGSGSGKVSNCYNTGSVTGSTNVGGIVGRKLTSSITNCYYLTGTATGGIEGSDVEGSAEGKTEAQFASGEVAYLLQGDQTDHIWGQNIDNGQPVQTVPALYGAKVYYLVANCAGEKSYTNNETAGTHSHNFDDNGFCINVRLNGGVCDAYEPAVLVTAENCTELGVSSDYVGYYAITNAGNLYWFADKVDNENDTYGSANVVLTKDITINSGTVDATSTGMRQWNPIGWYTVSVGDQTLFSGTFDGNGKTVSGLYYNDTSGNYVGLIAGLAAGGTAKNVTLSDSYILGDYHVGGIVGMNYGTITGCVNYAAVSSDGTVGGITGANYGTVELCGNAGQIINDNYYTGGIAGVNELGAYVRNCWNTGYIWGRKAGIAGIVGWNNGFLDNCWNTGTIDEGLIIAAGGVVGQNNYNPVNNCYSTGRHPLGVSKTSNLYDSCKNCEEKTLEQFASGEVAYLLQANLVTPEGQEPAQIWGQNIDNGQPVQTLPVFSDAKVYENLVDCADGVTYSNTQITDAFNHNYENGFCINVRLNGGVCDAYEPAVLVTAENCTELGLAESYIGYYAITNAGNLYWFADKVDNENDTYGAANVVLTKDITINSGTITAESTGMRQWNPIGSTQITFSGIFEGNGKTVSGLYYNNNADESTNYEIGLVARLTEAGVIRNVTLSNSYLRGFGYVGSIVGNNMGTVRNCFNNATISANGPVGGIAGRNDGTVELCSNAGQISSDTGFVGGIAGMSYNNSISNCYNVGSVTGRANAGGVVGSVSSALSNCYNIGSVTGSSNVGGVAGEKLAGTITNGYYLTGTATGGITGSDAEGSAEGRTADQFASGELAYLLQGSQTEQIWGQNIDNGLPVQTAPVLFGAKVYQVTNCIGEKSYTNSETAAVQAHSFDDNGFCTNPGVNGDPCDAYEPAVLVTAENRETLGLAESYIGYYAITNAGNLYWFADKVDNENDTYGTANVVLTKDITINSGEINADSTGAREWNPIGDSSNHFGGIFDGNGKAISGLYFNKPKGDYSYKNEGVALVAYLEKTGIVQNVTLTNSYLYVYAFVGSMVGENEGTIRNCFNYATIGSYGVGYGVPGGIVSYNLSTGIIEFCGNAGQVSGENATAGGIASPNYGIIRNCWNTGSITSSGNYSAGGIASYSNTGSITNCYNAGSITSFSGSGGIVAQKESLVTVKNCYYLTGTATGGIGGSDAEGSAESKTAEQFASGEVAYLLQGEQADQIWGQNIDNGQPVQTLPVFSDAKVYQATNCIGEKSYTNSETAAAQSHSFDDNGFCTNVSSNGIVCDAYEPAVLVTAENCTELGLAESYIGYYAITNAGNLYWFADKVDNENDTYGTANVVLTKDITINSGTVDATSTGMRQWTPIGDENKQFGGTFDGNGKTVSGLYYNDTSGNYVGLIAKLAAGGTAKNVTLSDSYILGYWSIGGIVGDNRGIISGCVNYAAVSGSDGVGGVAGTDSGGTVEFCGNAGPVSSDFGWVGGIACGGSYVRNCWNTGSVIGGGNCVGGVVGSGGDVSNCWNTGSVTGDKEVGGVAGNVSGELSNCYSTGIVTGDSYLSGGVAGYQYSSTTITNCYYLTGTSARGVGGYRETEEGSYESKTEAQFASGQVAYLLQGEQADQIWGQNIDNGQPVQTLPALYGAKVYYLVANCAGEKSYTNNETAGTHSHNFDDNGFCINVRLNGGVCDAYEPAVLVTAENCTELGLAESYIGYYAITNAGNLYWFADKVDNENATYGSANVVLTDNITVNSGEINADSTGVREWNPIGKYVAYTTTGEIWIGYSGIFEGNGKTISGLYFNQPENDTNRNDNIGIALVGMLEETGVVQNVTLTKSYLYGCDDVASMVAENYGTVRNCYNYATIGSASSGGGIVHKNHGTVTGCVNYAAVSGNNSVGGVVGTNDGGTVELCGNAGQVTGISEVGGVVSHNYKGTVRNCWNTGSVTGNSAVGGVVGYERDTLSNCWNTGSVTGDQNVGGVVGFVATGAVSNCYYLTGTAAGGITGSNVKGSAESKTAEQFASGQVAYLLQGEQADQIWGQNIDNGQPVQTLPVFSDAKVYQATNCIGEKSYTNFQKNGQHEPTYVAAVESTCTETGNVEHWHCSLCQKYFLDEACTSRITDVIIPAKGHHYDANGVCDNINRGVVCGYVAEASVITANSSLTYYDTLQKALNAVEDCTESDETVVTVRKDINITDGMAGWSKGGVFTLDIGEYDITGSNYALQMNDSTVKVTGTTGTINRIYLLKSDLTVEGGNVTCGEAETAIMVNNSDLTVTGGTVGSTENRVIAVYACYDSSVTIGGSAKLLGNRAVEIDGEDATLSIAGGVFEAAVDIAPVRNASVSGSVSGGIFTDGITIVDANGEDLNGLLAEGYRYWQNGQQLDVEDGITTLSGTVEVMESCKHKSIMYTAEGAKLISECDTCTLAAEAELVALTAEELVYNSSEKTVSATGTILGYDELPAVTYEGDRTNVGFFTAYLEAGGATARLTQEITPALITQERIQTVEIPEKIYDGTTEGDYIISSFFGPFNPARDEVYTLTAVYDSPDAGERKLTVTMTLMDNDAAKNYDFGEPGGDTITFVVDHKILPATITVTDVKVDDKFYDGTTDATVAGVVVAGVVTGDEINVEVQAEFEDKNSAENKIVNLAYSFSGADAGNYVLAEPPKTTTASIKVKPLEDILEPVKDVNENTVTFDDRGALEAVKEELEFVLTDEGLSDEQRQEREDAKEAIQKLLDLLDQVQKVIDAIEVLPDEVQPDTERRDEILAAKDAFDALTDHQKELVPEELVKKLNKLLEDLRNYKIIQGDGLVWVAGDVTFTANGHFRLFVELKIDENVVPADNYTVKSGSTIVTLKESYLKSLAAGNHSISFVYPDGQAVGSFTVKVSAPTGSEPTTGTPTNGSPTTGDNAPVMLLVVMMTVSLAGAAMLLQRKRKV